MPRLGRIPLVAAVLLTARPLLGADLWVENGGNDALDGLSPATAWATLGHAADVVDPGDTVHVLDGSYQGFYLSRSGLPGSPITFHAEGPNVRITADNGTTPDGIRARAVTSASAPSTPRSAATATSAARRRARWTPTAPAAPCARDASA